MKAKTYKLQSDETLLNWYSELVNVTRNEQENLLFILIKDELNNRIVRIYN